MKTWEGGRDSDWIVELVLPWKWLVEAEVMRFLIEVEYGSTGQKGRLVQKFSASEPWAVGSIRCEGVCVLGGAVLDPGTEVQTPGWAVFSGRGFAEMEREHQEKFSWVRCSGWRRPKSFLKPGG